MTARIKPGDLGWMVLVGATTLVANGTPFGNSLPDSVFNALAFNILQFGVPAVLALRAADAAVDAARAPALLAYSAAVGVTVVGGVWLIAPALYPLLGKAPWWTSQNDWGLASTTLIWHALGVAVYAQLRASSRVQARLLSLQAGATQRGRELAAARLLALQARVDPALLAERLQCIDAELASEPQRAQARLAALIELLRALQPHLQARVSSLPRELAALRAYAHLMSADAQHTERLHLAGLSEPPDWPLAPLVLLPLVRPLLDAGQTLWSLALYQSPGQAELCLQALGPDAEQTRRAAQALPLAELTQRLQAVHGDSARLQLRPGNEADLPALSLIWPIPMACQP